jgi:hypothetical protein
MSFIFLNIGIIGVTDIICVIGIIGVTGVICVIGVGIALESIYTKYIN